MHSLTKLGAKALAISLMLILLGGASKKAAEPSEDPDKLPWVLRDHYTFKVMGGELDYAVGNGEFRMQLEGLGEFIKSGTIAVELGDGTTLTTEDLSKGETHREPFTDTTGAGTCFPIDFPAVKGLQIRHALVQMAERPYMLIQVELKNVSAAPIAIRRVSSLVVNQPGEGRLSPSATYSPRPLTVRGGVPVYVRNGRPLTGLLEDTVHKVSMTFGVFPRNEAHSGPNFSLSEGVFQGDISSDYDPPIQLAPGETLSAEPAWLCLSMPNPDEVDTLYAWCHSTRPQAVKGGAMPKAWVSAPAGTPYMALQQSAATWLSMGIAHVLIPSGWEGRPGSMEGSSGYAKNMGAIATRLNDGGFTPGLTIDPLSTPSGLEDWSTLSEDGQRWLNLRVPEGRAQAVKNVQKMTGWGYRFFAVEPSRAPDDVLQGFNMTRAQADTLALAVVTEGAPGVLVLPTALDTLDGNVNEWSKADLSLRKMSEFQMAIGPVRFHAAKDVAVTPELAEAIRGYHGVIELVGAPSGRNAQELNGVFPRGRAARSQ